MLYFCTVKMEKNTIQYHFGVSRGFEILVIKAPQGPLYIYARVREAN